MVGYSMVSYFLHLLEPTDGWNETYTFQENTISEETGYLSTELCTVLSSISNSI